MILDALEALETTIRTLVVLFLLYGAVVFVVKHWPQDKDTWLGLALLTVVLAVVGGVVYGGIWLTVRLLV